MPMYEYKCGQCGQVFELIQRFSDEPLTTHEGCGGSVERLISAPTFQFKGSGFYITDYAKKSGTNAPASKGESKGESKSESNGSSASDSKPAASTPNSTSSSTSSSDTKK